MKQGLSSIWLRGRKALPCGCRLAAPALRQGCRGLALGLLCAFWLCLAARPLFSAENRPQDSISSELDRLGELERYIVQTSLGKESIPAIDRPVYMSTSDASLTYEDSDIVFVAEFGPEEVRIYPQHVLVWHEILNDVLGEERITITYCPLTGSVIGYRGRVGRVQVSFGTSGRLVNNNLLMYDRETHCQWPQIPGIAIDGPLRGTELQAFPLIWTTWGLAKFRYPEAQVLTRNTGFRRSYGRDPYGSYHREGTYYSNHVIVHPLNHFDKRLPPKERILALKGGGRRVALVRSAVIRHAVLSFDLGTPCVSFYDPALDTVRVFDSRFRGQPLHFFASAGKLYDQETGSEWSGDGRAVGGALRGAQLVAAPAFDCMWFAWAAFYPDTEIIDGSTPEE